MRLPFLTGKHRLVVSPSLIDPRVASNPFEERQQPAATDPLELFAELLPLFLSFFCVLARQRLTFTALYALRERGMLILAAATARRLRLRSLGAWAVCCVLCSRANGKILAG